MRISDWSSDVCSSDLRESDKVAAAVPDRQGSELSVFGFGPFHVGLFNCYDLRFPEITRALVDEGADVLLVGSARVAGDHKSGHWRTLLKARAIENTSYVIASNHPGPSSVGGSMIVEGGKDTPLNSNQYSAS